MSAFKDYCMKMAEHNDMLPTSDTNLDESTSKRIDGLVKIMELKMDRLDKISVPPFIESVFDCDVTEKLNAKTVDGDIPDAVINTLAAKLYHHVFKELDDAERSVIKILSVYIILQD